MQNIKEELAKALESFSVNFAFGTSSGLFYIL
jgi:hypothetical protein